MDLQERSVGVGEEVGAPVGGGFMTALATASTPTLNAFPSPIAAAASWIRCVKAAASVRRKCV